MEEEPPRQFFGAVGLDLFEGAKKWPRRGPKRDPPKEKRKERRERWERAADPKGY